MTDKKTSTRKAPALSVEPMNKNRSDVVRYPTISPASLSFDAQLMYRFGGDEHRRLDRDIFDPQATRRYVSRSEGDAFVPTDRMLKAIDELVDAGLATYDPAYGKSLPLVNAHRRYTIARGRGSSFIQVSLFDAQPDRAQLIATILGGDLEGRSNHSRGMTEIAVRSRHETATDFEHSAASTAMLTLINPSAPVFDGYGAMTLTATLTEARLYPLGVDPLTASDGDTDGGDVCDMEACHYGAHPFAPYLPPVVETLKLPALAVVRVLPLRPYAVARPPAYIPARTAVPVDKGSKR